MISGVNKGVNNTIFKQSSEGLTLAEKRTIVNALDTLDLERENCKKEVIALNKWYQCIPVLAQMPLFSIGLNCLAPKAPFLKFLAMITGTAAIGIAGFGLTNIKHAQRLYKSEILAQKESGITEIANPKSNNLANSALFMPITNERLQEIDKNTDINSIKEKKYKDDNKITQDYDLDKHKDFADELKNTAFIAPSKTSQTAVSDFISQIDENTKDYSKKVKIGMNSILAFCSLVGASLSILLSKIGKTLTKNSKNKFVRCIVSMIPMLPLCGLFLATECGLVKDIDRISRLKAKEGFQSTQNSVMSTTLDYLKTRKEYSQKIRRQKDLVPVRNRILAKSEANERAKTLQQDFFAAIKSEDSMNNKLQDSFKSGFLDGLILYSIAAPALLLLLRGLLCRSDSSKFNKMAFASYGLLSTVFASNALITYKSNSTKE